MAKNVAAKQKEVILYRRTKILQKFILSKLCLKKSRTPLKLQIRIMKKFDKKDLINIAILTFVILAAGIYLIKAISLISNDGITYINSAKTFANKGFVRAVADMRVSFGYPFFINLTHKILSLTNSNSSSGKWILSAQIVSLFSKLTASIVLYFISSCFTERKTAFWGVVILSLLPDSAEYGSDALTEWPFLMFLAIGFLLLIKAAEYEKVWLFGLTGLAAGIGYFVRSECCQLVIYGVSWLLFKFLKSAWRTKVIFSFIVLLAGFFIAAAPYMLLKGYVFPDQKIFKIPALFSEGDAGASSENPFLAGLSIAKIKNDKTIVKNICETLVYYFVPAMLIGLYYYFKRIKKSKEHAFFIGIFIVFNILMFLWQLYGRQLSSLNFLSRRHTLALVVFTAFSIPVGLEIISQWISRKLAENDENAERGRQWLFYILLGIGIFICIFKIANHTVCQKYGYRDAAQWLSKNTNAADLIAVPDKRIAFYADRRIITYRDSKKISPKIKYVVLMGDKDELLGAGKDWDEKYSSWVDCKKRKRIIICARKQ